MTWSPPHGVPSSDPAYTEGLLKVPAGFVGSCASCVFLSERYIPTMCPRDETHRRLRCYKSIWIEATPENIAKSVEWRLTR